MVVFTKQQLLWSHDEHKHQRLERFDVLKIIDSLQEHLKCKLVWFGQQLVDLTPIELQIIDQSLSGIQRRILEHKLDHPKECQKFGDSREFDLQNPDQNRFARGS